MIDTSLSDPAFIAKILAPEDITQICIGKYDVIFNFTGDLSILIQSKIEITSNLLNGVISSESPQETKNLVFLLGKRLQSHRVEDGDVVLVFSDGSLLRLLRNDYYESFSFTKGEDGICV